MKKLEIFSFLQESQFQEGGGRGTGKQLPLLFVFEDYRLPYRPSNTGTGGKLIAGRVRSVSHGLYSVHTKYCYIIS